MVLKPQSKGHPHTSLSVHLSGNSQVGRLQELSAMGEDAAPRMRAAVQYRIARKVTWRRAAEILDAYRGG